MCLGKLFENWKRLKRGISKPVLNYFCSFFELFYVVFMNKKQEKWWLNFKNDCKKKISYLWVILKKRENLIFQAQSCKKFKNQEKFNQKSPRCLFNFGPTPDQSDLESKLSRLCLVSTERYGLICSGSEWSRQFRQAKVGPSFRIWVVNWLRSFETTANDNNNKGHPAAHFFLLGFLVLHIYKSCNVVWERIAGGEEE